MLRIRITKHSNKSFLVGLGYFCIARFKVADPTKPVKSLPAGFSYSRSSEAFFFVKNMTEHDWSHAKKITQKIRDKEDLEKLYLSKQMCLLSGQETSEFLVAS
jgi:hypothetical protein